MEGNHANVITVPGSGRQQGPCPRPHDDPADEMAPSPALGLPGSLLLLGHEAFPRTRLGRALVARGFAVTSVDSAKAALAAAIETRFAYAVVEMRLDKGDGFGLIRRLRELHAPARIVVVTDHDSFAGAVLAVRAGEGLMLSLPGDNDVLLLNVDEFF